MALTSDERVALLREVYELVTGSVESLQHDDRIGPDLAYLLGAILNDTGCAWPEDRPIISILREHFPDGHPVHRFVEVESEGLETTEVRVTDLPAPREPTMKRAQELAHEQLVALINALQSILWNDAGAWNADKTWDAVTIESVAAVLEDAGLRPQPPSDLPVIFLGR